MLVRHASDEAKLKEGGHWDEEAGQKVIRTIEKNLYLEGGGKFTLPDYLKDIIRSWYCWIRPDGLRYTKWGLLTCGRKNAKSILTYGLTFYHLVGDGRMSPSVVSVACDKKQAAQIFDWLRFAIDQNPNLNKALHYIPGQKTVTYPKKNGVYVSGSSEVNNKFGRGQDLVIYDEMAFFPTGDKIFQALKDAGASRPGSMQIITSTAGWNKNGAFFKQVLYGRKILNSEIIDTSYQPWIFEVPEGTELKELDKEDTWRLANPGLGITQNVREFGDKWARDKWDVTTRLSAMRLMFNMQTDAEQGWITPEAWDACKSAWQPEDGAECILGFDIGATRDLTAASAIFPRGDGTYFMRVWAWVPEGALQTKDKVNADAYTTFQQEGSLTITAGTATEPTGVIKFLDELRQRYRIRLVVWDKWQSLVMSEHLRKESIPSENFPQTHNYFNAPCLMLEKLVNSKQILHEGTALMRWQIGHTYLDRNSKGYVKPETIRPENKKDNIISTLMALSHALSQPQQSHPQFFFV